MLTIFLTLIINQSNSQKITESIPAYLTDSRISMHRDTVQSHYFYTAHSKRKNKLLLVLPGTNGKPANLKLFCSFATEEGYDVIALKYPDSIPVLVCKNDKNANCFENTRIEIIEGKDLSPYVQIDYFNSIEFRLNSLLKYLAHSYPKQYWKHYLKDSSVKWKKTVVSGLSQGGGHAAYLAKKHHTAGAILFGAPKDYADNDNLPAAWLRGDYKTPMKNIFAFVHSKDDKNGCTFIQQLEIFEAMKLRGVLTDVDTIQPPYNKSRRLTAHREEKNYHISVIYDPAFKPVWKYILDILAK